MKPTITVCASTRVFAYIIASIIICCAVHSWAIGAPSLPATGQIFSVTGEGVQTNGGASVRDLGSLDPVTVSRVSQRFVLKNISGSPVEIESLTPSCHCTTASLSLTNSPMQAAVLPVTLAPGESANVDEDVSLDGDTPGSYIKNVTVQAESSGNQSETTLTLRFVLPSAVTIQPSFFNLGLAPKGKIRSTPITVVIDSRLASEKNIPALVASSPYFNVSQGPTITSGTTNSSSPKKTSLTYNVSISDQAPIGPVSTTLYYSVPPQVDPATDDPSSSAWLGARGLVVGMVTGEAAANPSSVNFGTLTYGNVSTMDVKVVGTKAALANAQAIAQVSWLALTLGDLTTYAPPPGSPPTEKFERDLTIAVGPASPIGILRTAVRVELGNGQRIEIQVSAYVPTPGPIVPETKPTL